MRESLARPRDGERADVNSPETPNAWTMLHALRDDMTWRIGWAAKNDDGEAAGLYIALQKAIDDVLNFGHVLWSARRDPTQEGANGTV